MIRRNGFSNRSKPVKSSQNRSEFFMVVENGHFCSNFTPFIKKHHSKTSKKTDFRNSAIQTNQPKSTQSGDISVVILLRSSKNIIQKQAKKTDFRNSAMQTNQPAVRRAEPKPPTTNNQQPTTNNHQSSIINHQSSIINHQPSIINPKP
ncbi:MULTISPECIES: hypothetical protein [unclassified Chryseobacterium]|uniref:hypothetical protein n=1 Tax=unclassified Chryseobacterium TaxID=2593645 RepID=UPI00301784B5